MKRLLAFAPLIFLLVISVALFIPSILQGKILLPADTIVGLYHPYRDLYADTNPNGVAYKNALVTDPVRQQYPWKSLSISTEQARQLPTWNPYTFAGGPLLANMQSAVFYPLNVIFLLTPFAQGWNIFVLSQLLLGSLFMFLYLRNLKLAKIPSFLGSFVFIFSGFSVAWFEWGNILHTAIWLPLILLSIDKLLIPIHEGKIQLDTKRVTLFSLLLIGSMSAALFAGHLQTFFYIFIIAFCHAIARWTRSGRSVKHAAVVLLCFGIFALMTFVQWFPTLQLIQESARELDQGNWMIPGWFIPWQHSIQFLAPDFFGNPATLNYFGVWNYAEFVGYIGIVPLAFALFALFRRHDKKTLSYAMLLLVGILFAYPTFLAMLPFQLSLPFISSAQPTRLLFVIDFALAVLSALGFDYFIRVKKGILLPNIVLITVLGMLWGTTLFAPSMLGIPIESLSVVKRNLQLPTILIVMTICGLLLVTKVKQKNIVQLAIVGLVLVSIFDLYRFSYKFTPVSPSEYLYPQTKTTEFLVQNLENDRYVALDSRILPPNFSIMYGLQTIEGYDPLYLRRYGELIIASERAKPDITPPFGFNRILTPHRTESPIINLLGVKYFLTLSDMQGPNITLVMREGETRMYRNTRALPRAFFVTSVTALGGENKQKAIEFLFSGKDLRAEAIVEDVLPQTTFASGSANIRSYTPSKVLIQTELSETGFLVLTDSYYPTWRARLHDAQGKSTSELDIVRTNYQFRGVVVPKGTHVVEFTNTLFSL